MAKGFFKLRKGITVQPVDLAAPGAIVPNEQGDLAVDQTTGKVLYHNGASVDSYSPIVTEDHTATLKNKTINTSDANTIKINGNALDATLGSATLTLPNSTDTLVGRATTDTLTNKTIDSDFNTISNIVDADIKAGAAIAYSKLALTGSIVNSDISASAQIAYSKLALSGSIVNADISASAQIAYSKLSLANSIVDADVASNAAIAYSKLAALTADRALVSNGSGAVSASSITGTELGHLSGLTTNVQTHISSGGASLVHGATSAATAGAIVARDSNGDFSATRIYMTQARISEALVTEAQDLSLSGSTTTLAATKSYVKLTSGTGSIVGINGSLDGKFLILQNSSGASTTIQNDSAATGVSNKILTGTGGPIALENNASLLLVYNNTTQKWQVIGGTGGGGSSTVSVAASNAAIAVGDAVYLDSSGIAQKLDAANDAKVEFLGVSLDAGGGAIRVQVAGEVTISGASFTVGKPVYANPSVAGGYTSTLPTSAGQWVIPVGVATAATKMAINGAGSATAVKITSEVDAFVYASVRSVSTTQSLNAGDSIVLATGGASGITLTLPSPVSGRIVNIKKIDAGAGAITINTASGTIDGSSSKTISIQYASLTITSDGTNFFII